MATTVTKIILSGSTNGKPIKVVATATPGTTIHTGTSNTTAGNGETCIVSVYNSDTVDRTITFECGGTASPDNHVKRTIFAGDTVGVPLPFINSTGVVGAFGSAANVLVVSGYAEKIVVS